MPDDTLRWMSVIKRPLLDDHGDVVGVLGVQNDITESSSAAKSSCVRARRSFDLFFALSPLGINLQDMDGRYIDTNDAFLSIVGYTRDELLNITCYELIPPEYLDSEPERLRRLNETGTHSRL